MSPTKLDRRDFLGRLVGGAAAAGLSRIARPLMAATEPMAALADGAPGGCPNVLFIVSDDLNDWVGTFGGHPNAHTHNIDRLCRGGVTFQRAYTPSPLCNPARAAIMTGKMPSTTGVYDNRQPFRLSPVVKDAATLPQYLMQQGYYAAAGGKIYHMKYPDPPSWNDYESLSMGAQPDEDDMTAVGKLKWGPIDKPEGATADAIVADYTIRQLERKHDQPFFLGCGFKKPHLPWFAPAKYFEMFPPDKITLPPIKDDDLDDVPPIARKWAKTELHQAVMDAGRRPEAVAAYLATVSYMDAQVGRVLDALDASGYADNTIIVFWGDHGWHLGEKRHWAKCTLWEEAARAPLTIVAPGVTSPNTVCPRTVSLIDLYPTLMELCGLEAKPGLDGVSLVPLLKDPQRPWDRPAVTDFKYGNTSVRSERWRYTRYADGTEEVYDHDADPMEWTNLADDPACAEVKTDLARWLPKRYAPEAPHRYLPGDRRP